MGLLLLKLNTGRKVGPQLSIKLITTEGENRVHETLHTYSESAPLGAAPKTAAGGWWTPPAGAHGRHSCPILKSPGAARWPE